MNQRIAKRTIGLVDYEELETNVLSAIREGRPLTGRDGALTPLIKKLLEVSLEGEIENHCIRSEVWFRECSKKCVKPKSKNIIETKNGGLIYESKNSKKNYRIGGL